MKRSMMGFLGPRYLPPDALQQILPLLFEGLADVPGVRASAATEKKDASLLISCWAAAGDDFAVMGMHSSSVYEHQESAGAHQGLINIINRHPHLLNPIEPAMRSADHGPRVQAAFRHHRRPQTRDPKTRQAAQLTRCSALRLHDVAQALSFRCQARLAKLELEELVLRRRL